MARLGLFIDTRRCVSCYACRSACQANNQLAADETFIRYETKEVGAFPNVRLATAPRQCAHCDDAPCVKVCPTRATYRADDGTVQVDSARCIGCGYCAAACPYGARTKLADGTYAKCSLCSARVAQGESPYCVDACIAGARLFGDLEDGDSDIARAIAEAAAAPLGGDLTGASIYYAR